MPEKILPVARRDQATLYVAKDVCIEDRFKSHFELKLSIAEDISLLGLAHVFRDLGAGPRY